MKKLFLFCISVIIRKIQSYCRFLEFMILYIVKEGEMEDSYEKFNVRTGRRIMEIRLKRHYTREYLAELADISAKFLYEIEVGKKGCSAYVLYRVSIALDVNLSCLLQDQTWDLEDLKTVYMLLEEKQKKSINSIIQIVYTMLNEF